MQSPYATTILLFVLAVMLCVTFIQTLARRLNVGRLSPVLPEEFKGWYDEAAYATSQRYQREAARMADIQEAVHLALVGGFLFLGGLGWAESLSRSLFSSWGEIPVGLGFVAVLGLLGTVIDLPFDIWRTFGLEARYGFNKTTPALFVSDRLKGLALTILLGGPLIAAIFWLYAIFPGAAWLWSWITVAAFSLTAQYLAPTLIMPLFNRFEPLPEGSLKTAIEDYARAQNFALEGLFVMDGSKRSTRGNAFFTGFGKRKRIALFDTIIAELTVPEMTAVLAHEIGHYRLRHILTMTAANLAKLGLVFYILGRFLDDPALHAAFGFQSVTVHGGLTAFFLVWTPVSVLLSLVDAAISRKNEYAADRFAARTTGRPEDLVTGLKKLTVNNLGNLTPHPFYVWLNYSHPPILERIAALRGEKRVG